MVDEFTVGFRNTEREVDVMVALSMSAEGVGAALFLIAWILGAKGAALFGLLLVSVGIAALFSHLGHPLRFWRVLSKASAAWISRGALVTGGLVVAGIASLVSAETSMIGLTSQVVALLCALLVMLYAGLLYSSMPAVPFWNSALLPLLFFFHSLASGAGLALCSLPMTGESLATYPRAVAAVLALMFFCLALTVIYSRPHLPSAAVKESVRLLTQGKLRSLFRDASLLLGLLVPVALIALCYLVWPGAGVLSTLTLLTMVVLRLGGDISFRYAVLRAGVYEPVV